MGGVGEVTVTSHIHRSSNPGHRGFRFGEPRVSQAVPEPSRREPQCALEVRSQVYAAGLGVCTAEGVGARGASIRGRFFVCLRRVVGATQRKRTENRTIVAPPQLVDLLPRRRLDRRGQLTKLLRQNGVFSIVDWNNHQTRARLIEGCFQRRL
jgi:hypothetical protein